MPTASTVPLLLLVVILWRVTKGELLSIILFLSIFQAASAINLGDMGIAPWIVALALGLLFKLAKYRTAPLVMTNVNSTAIRLLFAFVGYATFSGLVFPILFSGVLAQGSHDSSPAPLTLSIANIAQICYLLTAVTVFGVALFSTREALSSALDWYIRGCVVTSFFAVYQLVNAVTGVPYPSALLYSNPRYVIYPAYMIDGMWRLSSTFTEASSLAGHLSVGIALLGWKVVTHPLRWQSSLGLLLMVLTLLLTLSSTGYLSMIVILLVGGALTMRVIFLRRSLARAKAILLLSVLLAGIVTLLISNVAVTVNKAVHSVLLDKEDSLSYRERTASNRSAMETSRQTYYMGAGWGSVRCSSLGPGLMATVGVIGVVLFCAFLISLTRPLFVPGYKSQQGDIYEMSLLGTLVILAAMMVASNEPDQPILWVLFAACAAGPTSYQLLRKDVTGDKVSHAFRGPATSS